MGAEPGHRKFSELSVPGEGPGHWPGAACKAYPAVWQSQSRGCPRTGFAALADAGAVAWPAGGAQRNGELNP